MSLRWSSYVALKPQRGLKTQNGRFRSKIALRLKKVCYRVFFCVKIVSDKVVKHCLVYISVQKWLVGATPSTWNFGSIWPHWSEIADCRFIFVRGASAVTSSEVSSINTNRKSTTRFPMSLRWTSYVVPKPPKKVAQNAKCPKFEQ